MGYRTPGLDSAVADRQRDTEDRQPDIQPAGICHPVVLPMAVLSGGASAIPGWEQQDPLVPLSEVEARDFEVAVAALEAEDFREEVVEASLVGEAGVSRERAAEDTVKGTKWRGLSA